MKISAMAQATTTWIRQHKYTRRKKENRDSSGQASVGSGIDFLLQRRASSSLHRFFSFQRAFVFSKRPLFLSYGFPHPVFQRASCFDYNAASIFQPACLRFLTFLQKSCIYSRFLFGLDFVFPPVLVLSSISSASDFLFSASEERWRRRQRYWWQTCTREIFRRRKRRAMRNPFVI
jgi:hypothetical protein